MKLKNKNILVYGLGKSGRSTIKFLLEKQAKVFLYDDDKKALSNFKNPQVTKFDLKLNLRKIDMVVVAPGVYNSSLIKVFETLKIKIINEIELASIFVRRSKIIAITGTNGKTSTTQLLEKLLKNAGKKATACGNIGVSFLDNLNKDELNHYYIVEVSSFQLERIKSFKPDISIILNITPDHLNRHKSFEEYERLKLSIAKNQGKKEFCIVNYLIESELLVKRNFKAKSLTFGSFQSQIYADKLDIYLFGEKFASLDDLKLSSEQILDNYFVTILVSNLLKIDKQITINTIKNFKQGKHRIEKFASFNGVTYINDSKATNPSSTIFALQKINNPNVILLLGGHDKNLNFEDVFYFTHLFKKVICFGKAGMQIFTIGKNKNFENIAKEETLLLATKKAISISEEGDIVLLSPACASFDEFKDYKERGVFFKGLVNAEHKNKK